MKKLEKIMDYCAEDNIGAYDSEFIVNILELVYSGDSFFEQSLSLVERIFLKYGFSDLFLTSFNFQNSKVLDHCHYHCVNNEIVFEKRAFPWRDSELKDDNFYQRYDESGRLIYRNIDAIPGYFMSNHLKTKFNAKSLASFMVSSYKNQAYLISACKKVISNWSTYDINTMQRAAKTLTLLMDLDQKIAVKEAKINELLSKDNTTNTYTFECFLNLVRKKVLKNTDKTAVYISFDINHFSYIYQSFGENASTFMLCFLVKQFEDLYDDIIISRLYGDNFMAFAFVEEEEKIVKKLLRLNKNFTRLMNEKFSFGDVSLAMGVFLNKDKDMDVKTCTNNAEYAHKAFKNLAKYSIHVYSAEDEKICENKKKVEENFKKALQNNEFLVYLQPKMNLSTHKVVGAEALSRWVNSEQLLVLPFQFIPVLEKNGYIAQLDMYIYEQTVKALRKWLDEGYEVFPISVNFSKLHFSNVAFVNSLILITSKYDVPHGYIEIEITETTFAINSAQFIACLNALRNAGFKLSMDDFGAGYSSLNMLMNIPVDIIKIDKSFLEKVDKSRSHRNFLVQVAQLIKLANKTIIFEGVETETQAKLLLENNLFLAQGYLFSRPIPLEDFESKFMVKKQILN